MDQLQSYDHIEEVTEPDESQSGETEKQKPSLSNDSI